MFIYFSYCFNKINEIKNKARCIEEESTSNSNLYCYY